MMLCQTILFCNRPKFGSVPVPARSISVSAEISLLEQHLQYCGFTRRLQHDWKQANKHYRYSGTTAKGGNLRKNIHQLKCNCTLDVKCQNYLETQADRRNWISCPWLICSKMKLKWFGHKSTLAVTWKIHKHYGSPCKLLLNQNLTYSALPDY